MASIGIRPGRGKGALLAVSGLDGIGAERFPVDKAWNICFARLPRPIELSLAPAAVPVARIRVEFLSPTELTTDERLAPEPVFSILFKQARDRVSNLRHFYGDGPLDIDFPGIGQRAEHVRLTHLRLLSKPSRRLSRSTGQSHSIGGFVGEAEYEGELAEFVPFLEAAYWTGVGRHTVWGDGAVRLLEAE